MKGRHFWAAGALLATALATGVALVVSPAQWHPTTAFVLAASLLTWATVAVVATLLEHSRLGYLLGVFALMISAAVALLQPISAFWWIEVALLATTAFLFSNPTLGGWIRQRTSAAPVPALAVALALTLLLVPGLTALVTTQVDPGQLPILSLFTLILLFGYVRRPSFALAGVRVMPLLLAIVGWWLPSPGRWVWMAGQLMALALAWTKEVRLAVRPLIERGSKVMIPPELAPEEIRRMLAEKPDGRE